MVVETTPPTVPQTPIQVPAPCAKSVTLAESPPHARHGQVEGSKGCCGDERGAGSMPVWSRRRGLVLQMMWLTLEGHGSGGGNSDHQSHQRGAGGRKGPHASPWLLHEGLNTNLVRSGTHLGLRHGSQEGELSQDKSSVGSC